MLRRHAVAATVVSVVLFASSLLASYEILESVQYRSLYSGIAEREVSLSSNASVAAHLSSFILLEREQEFISSGKAACNTSLPSMSYNETYHGLNASARISETGLFQKDNDSLLSPFSGSYPGLTDFYVSASVSGRSGVIEISRNESYFLNIPFRIYDAREVCLQLHRMLIQAMDLIKKLGICNATLISETISFLSSEFYFIAFLHGFSVSLSYSFNEKSCTLSYTLSVIQNNVRGPSGFFDARLSESGSFSFHKA